MKKNMSSTDKAIRLLVAALILILAFTKAITGIWAIVLIILAVVFILTSIFGICPLYLALGIHINRTKE